MACGDVGNLFKGVELASKPGTNSEIGSGVGLSMVKLFMDCFKGQVTYIHSDQGATFKLTFKIY